MQCDHERGWFIGGETTEARAIIKNGMRKAEVFSGDEADFKIYVFH